MNNKSRPTLKKLFNEWAEKHPAIDTFTYGTEKEPFTARELNQETQSETHYGKILMLQVSSAMRGLTLAELNRSMSRFKNQKNEK